MANRLRNHTMICGDQYFHWGRRTYVMGIINLTPDSFSGDGFLGRETEACEQAIEFQGLGADIIDIGAHSTRPGHEVVSEDEEISRLIPVLKSMVPRVHVPISVDTFRSRVASKALELGASIINDVWGLKADPDMASVVSDYESSIVLMHNQATTDYIDLLPDVMDSLAGSIQIALNSGIRADRIIVDPGIGFGKTAEHNIAILQRLNELKELGYPLLVGVSRKSTIGLILGLPVDERMEGTAATVALSISGGADIVRVHDVKEMTRVVKMSDAIVRDWRPQYWQA